MGEDLASEVNIKAVLNAAGKRAEGLGEADTKDEFQLSGRDAARFSLQSVALTVTPATAVANLAIPITLYDRAAPPEENHGGDLSLPKSFNIAAVGTYLDFSFASFA